MKIGGVNMKPVRLFSSNQNQPISSHSPIVRISNKDDAKLAAGEGPAINSLSVRAHEISKQNEKQVRLTLSLLRSENGFEKITLILLQKNSNTFTEDRPASAGAKTLENNTFTPEGGFQPTSQIV